MSKISDFPFDIPLKERASKTFEQIEELGMKDKKPGTFPIQKPK